MSTLIPSTAHYIRLALGKGRVNGDDQRRYVHIVRGMSSGLVAKGVAFVVSFFSVPLTVRYLGAERYGAWVTISAAMAWIALADFGLSSSLTNAVSEGYASDDHKLAGEYVAAAFWSLAGVALLLAAVFFPVWRIVPWQRVFNVESVQARAEIGPAVAIAFAMFVLNFPFSIIAKIYGAYQQVALANAWNTAGNVLSLAGLVVATQLKGGLASLVIAVSGSILFINVISAVWLFGWSKPWLFPRLGRLTWASLRKLTSLGGMFFVIQIAALLLFQTDNLIIAHYLGAAAVTPYSVTWRLFTYTMIFQMLATPSYWPAYAEAFARGDHAWVRRSFPANFRITVASTLVLVLPLVFFGQWIIRKWAGELAVPSPHLLLWMGVWSVIYAATCSQSCILASSNRLRGQMIYSISAAIVNIVVSILLVKKIGPTGAILGTISAYLTCILVPQWIEVERALMGNMARCAADPLEN
ncbi:MAG: oligosaccharide flippase family protein [Candidatus Sulfotelmatobacter sp.]